MSSKIRAKKKHPPSLITLLPEDIILDILACVPRHDYPTLSLVSKHLRSLVTSPEIYARQSSLVFTEHCLYVFLYNTDNGDKRWYILRLKADGYCRLFLIPSLPPMPRGNNSVSVGSRIYVYGELMNHHSLSMECSSHTVHPLPSMPVTITFVAGIIDGKIYVIGLLILFMIP